MQMRALKRALWEEQGGLCALCGKPMPRVSRRHADRPDSPTIDHKVPLAWGGGDTRDNFQLAHKRCNSLKGQRMPDSDDERADPHG